MVPKLSSRQQAQLAYLGLLAPKLQRIYSLVERMAAPKVDEAIMRGLRELHNSLKMNYDAALRSATTAEEEVVE